MMRLTVGRNDEDYQTIQEALDAVPYLEEAEVLISEGVYEEKLFSDKDNLTVRGLGHVVITNSDGANEIVGNRKRGTFRSYTAFFSGRKLVLENLTIENRAGSGVEAGQAIALYLDVREALLGHVRLFGHQDTLFLSPLPEKEREKGGFYGPRYRSPRVMCRSVIRNSCIEGDIDFIFGSGDALFDNCEIRSNGKGWIAAPSGRSDGIGSNICTSSERSREIGSNFCTSSERSCKIDVNFCTSPERSCQIGSNFTTSPGRRGEIGGYCGGCCATTAPSPCGWRTRSAPWDDARGFRGAATRGRCACRSRLS